MWIANFFCVSPVQVFLNLDFRLKRWTHFNMDLGFSHMVHLYLYITAMKYNIVLLSLFYIFFTGAIWARQNSNTTCSTGARKFINSYHL